MRFTLPPKTASPKNYFDVDYGGQLIKVKIKGKTFSMQTMEGIMCCAGRPLPDRYLHSRNIVERAWRFQANGRVFDGMDSRGIAADGTLWRWVGPLLGEQAEYQDANANKNQNRRLRADEIKWRPHAPTAPQSNGEQRRGQSLKSRPQSALRN